MVTLRPVDPGSPFGAQIGAQIAAADTGPIAVVNHLPAPRRGP